MESKEETELVQITRYFEGERFPTDDFVAVEGPLEILVNGEELVTLMRLPGGEPELVVGFLLTEGVIEGVDQVVSLRYRGAAAHLPAGPSPAIDVDYEAVPRGEGGLDAIDVRLSVEPDISSLRSGSPLFTGPGGAGGKAHRALRVMKLEDNSTFSPEVLLQLDKGLDEYQEVFRLTGGTHAVAVFDRRGEILIVREDVGRHNALDKAVGGVALTGADFTGKGLLLSGRLSLEMVYKGVSAGVPLICSVSAPTSLGVELAERAGCTLVGFLRGKGFNAYTHPERLG